jgi:hypothetical protein
MRRQSSNRRVKYSETMITTLVFLLAVNCVPLMGKQIVQKMSEEVIQVLVSADKTKISIRGRVVFEVKLKNISTGKVSVFGQLLWGHSGGLTLRVSDATGQLVTAEQLDDDMVVPSVLGDQGSYVVLLPNHFIGTTRTDSALNLFRNPGSYMVVVEYQSPVPTHYAKTANFWGRENGTVKSKPIRFEVTDR